MEKDFSSTPADEVQKKMQQGKVVLVDVRPKARFEDAHPVGAVSIPLYQKVRP